MKLLRKVLAATALLSTLSAGMVIATEFPAQPITIIVPASPGTSIDAITRFFASPLSSRLNVPVVVENRSGAGGLIAYREAAAADPDGYTLIMTGIPLYILPLFHLERPDLRSCRGLYADRACCARAIRRRGRAGFSL